MDKIYDLIIIGSGPAGLSAAVYASRAKLDTIVLQENFISGGQILNTYDVDNYLGLPEIGGYDLAVKFKEHAEKLGSRFADAAVLKIEEEGSLKKVITDQGDFLCRAVIISSGATHRKLGIDSEDRFTGKGVSYCATCDGAFFKDKITAVIGGGDVACEDALYLSRLCQKVYLIHRRDELRANKSLQEKVFAAKNIFPIWDSQVTEIIGDSVVTGITVKNIKENTENFLALSGVFIAVGIKPNSTPFKELLTLDKSGFIIASEDCKTSSAGIFAAGDIRTKELRQIVTAVSDGANAVFSAEKYIMQNAPHS